ncbi:regulatory signaling modulator protein AmpE [Microbulbifer agarilyticus]|uniref:regulatory signaling modulator protein AmpE n=1 Tax=Microbulbifer agarilyticus TaxID=260552 RepID=UPI001C93F46F|nr:regulatory signaling modulator protein AmpE [Microbulbifer agarilyticus]MBY6192125.1 regulatory signaling modulator protein AmpE [Microbulbifer agarilyticus]
MALLIVLLALALVQIWGSGGPLHRDAWFGHWKDFVLNRPALKQRYSLGFGILVLAPVMAVALLLAFAESMLGWLGVLLVSVPALLYCFGRGNFNDALASYLRAWYQGDLDAAKVAAGPLLGPDAEREVAQVSDAQSLHRLVFHAAVYRAFERLFAVLFWFLLLGVPGALLYRMSQLAMSAFARQDAETDAVSDDDAETEDGAENSQAEEGALAARWLWLIEWLPVRALGFSLAIVGNFAGCYRAWRERLTCKETTTADVLERYMEGALGGIDSSECSAGVAVNEGQRLCGAEVEAMQSLLSRALLMWITLMALYVLWG